MPMLILNAKDISEIIAKHYKISPEQISITGNGVCVKIEMPIDQNLSKPVYRNDAVLSSSEEIHRKFDH